MVDTLPDAMLVGFAENATVGVGEGVGELFAEPVSEQTDAPGNS